jgi:Replication-relaxation
VTSRTSKAEDALAIAIARRITDRDRQIATSLYEHRVLTAQQIYELYFDSLDRARDRLAQLHALRVIERFRPYRQRGSHPYHYLLDHAGALLLSSERGIDPSDLDYSRARTLRLASSQQLTHQVQANGIVTALAHALRATPGTDLVQWRGQRGCAQTWGELVRPDSYLRLQLPTGWVEAWFEHDRSTETHARLQDKLDRYAELAIALEQQVTLLLTLTSDHREQEVRRTLLPTSDVLLLTTTTARHHADPLAANWLPAASQARIAITDLPAR